MAAGAEASKDSNVAALRSVTEEVNAVSREIVRVEQETDGLLRKHGQFLVEEKTWTSMTSQVSLSFPSRNLGDVREKLMAAQQDLNDTISAQEADAVRFSAATEKARRDLEATTNEEAEMARECSALRSEMQEASQEAKLQRARDKENPPPPSLEVVAAQKVRTEALMQLSAARRSTTEAKDELSKSEEALRARKKEINRLAKKGTKDVAKLPTSGAAGHKLKASERAADESSRRAEELQKKVATWQKLNSDAQGRIKAAEGKLETATARREDMESKVQIARESLEAAQSSLAKTLEAKELARKDLQAAQNMRLATVVLTIFLVLIYAFLACWRRFGRALPSP